MDLSFVSHFFFEYLGMRVYIFSKKLTELFLNSSIFKKEHLF